MKDKPCLYSRKIKVQHPESGITEQCRVLNISAMSLQQLGNQLYGTISQSRAIIFKGWQNRGVKLDVDYQRLILAQINNLREINSAFTQFQAEAIISYEMIEMIIANKRAEVMLLAKENALKLMRADHALEIEEKQHRDNLMAIEDLATLRKKNLEKIDGEILKQRAEIVKMETENEELKIKVDNIRKLLETIDINSLSEEMQTYIYITIYTPNVSQFSDFSMNAKIQDILLEQNRLKVERQKADNRVADSEANVVEAKSKFAVHEINQAGNTDKGE